MRFLPSLIAITNGTVDNRSAAADTESIARTVERAAEAGLRGVLVREPRLSDRAIVVLARRLRDVLDRAYPGGAGWLGLHDRLHLARACRADAVHLGFRSLPLGEARSIAAKVRPGDAPALGFSAHADDRAESWSGADYLFFGPLYDTPSKRGLVEPTGLDGLVRAVERSGPRPVVAVGGLEPEHAARVRETGAHGMAVLRGVLGARDPGSATERYLAAWGADETGGGGA